MFPELTPTGGRSSGEEENTSSMSTTRRHSMSIKIRILKVKRLLSGKSITARIRDGELSPLPLRITRRKEVLDLIEISDSISTEPSSSDQECQ
jgi:hypothetical protein